MRYIIIFLIISACSVHSQTEVNQGVLANHNQFNQDSLRGSNTEFRNWWNVLRYDITLEPNFDRDFISGNNLIQFEIIKNSEQKIMQIDLQKPMRITKIIQVLNQNNKVEEVELSKLAYKRDGNVYFIDFKQFINKNDKIFKIKIFFEGKPKIAKNPPWDGGWIFTYDQKGRPWMSASVQGLGASAWYPNKDYQGDEPDLGASLSIITPENLTAVSNGRLNENYPKKLENNKLIYKWEVKNPINNYNIIPYIGYYVHFSDKMEGEKGLLNLDYWVMDYNLDKAKQHFQQVKPMISAFENWMGAYPFYEDGFKLVESPYLGMEHQSGIAYGNHYKNGYLGNDTSGSGWGKKFDFIIVHESGHEWFGNNITTKDVADMWVHEGFTTYSEALYVESRFGKQAANEYLQGIRQNILNQNPMISKYGINQSPDTDMYYKGANVVHTLRQWVNNDEKFKKLIRGLNNEFYHQTVTSNDIENYISKFLNLDLESFFNQYLRTKNIPVLEIKTIDNQVFYRWNNVLDNFEMPVKIKNSDSWIYPTTEWKVYKDSLNNLKPDDNFYISTEIHEN